MTTPQFQPGENIAVKVPAHEYRATVAFYRDVLGLAALGETDGGASTRFQFGEKILWVDRVEALSQAEIWLEIITDDIEAAAHHFDSADCARCDAIEALPAGMKAFWIAAPGNLIHLVAEATGNN